MLERMGDMGSKKLSPEVRTRAVRLLQVSKANHYSESAAMCSAAEKIGCAAETERRWVGHAERDQARRPGQTTGEAERIKEPELR